MGSVIPLVFNLTSSQNISIKIDGDTTLIQPFNCIEIDGSSSDVTVTLPAVSANFVAFGKMSFVRIDDFTNVNNIVKIVTATPADLDETNNEIILDIITGVEIYASKQDSKFRSVNNFSENRIQQLLTRSTGARVPNFSMDNYIKVDTTSEAHETAEITQGGEGWIYDRSTGLVPVSATQNSGVEVNFEFTDHPFKVGDKFSSLGWTPSAYSTTFPALLIVKAVADSDNVTVDLASDPGGNASVIGTASISGRTFVPRPHKVRWSPATGIDTNPANLSGNFIIHIDKKGNRVTESINATSVLQVFNGLSVVNSNTNIQIGLMARTAGVVDAVNAAITQAINTSKRIDETQDSLGTVNSSSNPLSISFNGANIKLNLNAGQGLVRSAGLLGDPGGEAPDIEILNTTVTQVLDLLVTRDNVIQAAGTDIDVTRFEDPNNPGTLITMTNNRSKINFYKGFPTEQFVTEILGQAEYGTIAIAKAADEKPEFPSLVEFGLIVQSVAVDKSETDLTANAELLETERIDLT